MAADHLEIERKFLVRELPPGFERFTAVPILQGYLVQDDAREVRLRLAGRDSFLTVKDGAGLVRREVETPITRQQFDTLWPLTEGRRLEKTRTAFAFGNLTIEIDRYTGELSPLCVAEVEFPTILTSERFQKPDFFGDEITGDPDYKNATLASHGAPHPVGTDLRIGVLPYLVRAGRLHVVLVTNSSQTRWIIPKGNPEPGMSRHAVGLMESFEEAGVLGSFRTGLHDHCKLKDGTNLDVYPLHATTVLAKWPEASLRKRVILPVAEAVQRITDDALAQCVLRLAARITE